jgi:hypothetical protein
MTIPAAQLETWSNQGATTTAEATHASVRYALEPAGTSLVRGHGIEIFLQGSYRNFTNIYSDSDVDIVVLLNETYTGDASRLVEAQRVAQQRDFASYRPVSYPWHAYRQDILESLRRHYGPAMVNAGNKAVKVLAGTSGRLEADVVPCLVHHLYTSYGTTLFTPTTFVEGVSFWDQAGRQVVNYPKEHIKNGQAKNGAGRTNFSYKPTVRMFKNARRYLVERGRLAAGTAPSYFLECLLYNVPDALFVADRRAAMAGILDWLLKTNLATFVCQNGQVPLFGPTPEQWNRQDANALILAMVAMWTGWPI